MNKTSQITLVNGKSNASIDVKDRGLAYGDGVFETMRIVCHADSKLAQIPLLEWHLKRFEEGVKRLKLGSVKDLRARFEEDVSHILATITQNTLCKIIVTRGGGGLGYQALEFPECQMITQVLKLPDYPAEFNRLGIKVKICQYRLASQVALAGIKHLNRLDQVLASQELQNEQEGLLFDQNDYLIEGVKSNVLLFEDDKIVTPKLGSCGVQGTLRQYLMANRESLGIEVVEGIIDRNRLDASDGLAMINSVFGLWPVRELDGSALPVHPHCKTIQKFLNQHLGY